MSVSCNRCLRDSWRRPVQVLPEPSTNRLGRAVRITVRAPFLGKKRYDASQNDTSDPLRCSKPFNCLARKTPVAWGRDKRTAHALCRAPTTRYQLHRLEDPAMQ